MSLVTASEKMTAAQFLDWVRGQPGHFELVEGKVFAMVAERNRHIDAKMEAWLALRSAVREAGLPLHVSGDGITVVIGENTVREPDVTVQTLPVDPDAVVANTPLVLVEVLSPSSEASDTGEKLAEYFSLESVRHYLIVDPAKRLIVHHARGGSEPGHIDTTILREGDLVLDPPGIAVAVAAFFDEGEN